MDYISYVIKFLNITIPPSAVEVFFKSAKKYRLQFVIKSSKNFLICLLVPAHPILQDQYLEFSLFLRSFIPNPGIHYQSISKPICFTWQLTTPTLHLHLNDFLTLS